MFLKKTGAELELLPDIHVGIHLFMKRGIWEGILMVIKRYPKANNPLVLNYDPSKPNRYIMYLGKSYHYGWAMSKALTTKDWKWRRVIPTEEDILKRKENRKNGWFLEELQKENNSYCLALD